MTSFKFAVHMAVSCTWQLMHNLVLLALVSKPMLHLPSIDKQMAPPEQLGGAPASYIELDCNLLPIGQHKYFLRSKWHAGRSEVSKSHCVNNGGLIYITGDQV